MMRGTYLAGSFLLVAALAPGPASAAGNRHDEAARKEEEDRRQAQMTKIGVSTSSLLFGTSLGNIEGTTTPGTTVVIDNWITGFHRVLTADPEGNYSIIGLPIGTYEVTVGPESAEVVVRAGKSELTPTEELSCNFSNPISDGGTTSGPWVVVEVPSTGSSREQNANSGGKLRLRDLAPGTYKVSVDGKTWEPISSYVTCMKAPRITRRPGGYHGERIEGTTTPGSTVMIERIDKAFRTEIVADENGNYRVKRLKPGNYKITTNGVTRYIQLRYVYYPRLKDVVDYAQ